MGKSTGAITCGVICILVLGGIAVLIAWAADRMKTPSFLIKDAAITSFNLTTDNRLNASLALSIMSHNGDSKYNIKYQAMAVVVFHNGFGLAFENIAGVPFVQGHGDDITFKSQPTAVNVPVTDPAEAAALRADAKDGKLNLEVRVRAKVRFQVKHWKHRSYVLKVECPSVPMDLSASNNFVETACNVDRF